MYDFGGVCCVWLYHRPSRAIHILSGFAIIVGRRKKGEKKKGGGGDGGGRRMLWCIKRQTFQERQVFWKTIINVLMNCGRLAVT